MGCMTFLESLCERVIVADGAMGSLLHARGVALDACFESLNAKAPQLIQAIHLEYLAAGAELIETNTFGANRLKLAAHGLDQDVVQLNRAGAWIAKAVCPPSLWVAGSVGPLGIDPLNVEPLSASDKQQIFAEQMAALVDGGVDLLLLETFTDLDELLLALEVAKRFNVPVVAQMAFTDDLRSPAGDDGLESLGALAMAGADVVGANCATGPKGLLKLIERAGPLADRPLSAFPNASFPQYFEGRYLFQSPPEYFAQMAAKMVEAGANLLGGCCGTTPAHVKALSQGVRGLAPAHRGVGGLWPPRRPRRPAAAPPPPANFLTHPKPILICEVDPPKGLDTAKPIEGAKMLARAGVDAFSVADNPLASIRMSSTVFGHLVQEATGKAAIVHFACRDRTLAGQQSELMGAATLGIHAVLAITGDPAHQFGRKSVFESNSFGLIELISKLNLGENQTGHQIDGQAGFVIGCAFNPNARSLDAELRRLEKKIQAGAHFVQTQPVYTPEAIQTLYEKTAQFGVPVFVGILPLVSYRNAEFLHNEVPGIAVPDSVRERFRVAPPEEGLNVGFEMARELIDEALVHAPGLYLITPFAKYELMAKLVSYARGTVPSV